MAYTASWRIALGWARNREFSAKKFPDILAPPAVKGWLRHSSIARSRGCNLTGWSVWTRRLRIRVRSGFPCQLAGIPALAVGGCVRRMEGVCSENTERKDSVDDAEVLVSGGIGFRWPVSQSPAQLLLGMLRTGFGNWFSIFGAGGLPRSTRPVASTWCHQGNFETSCASPGYVPIRRFTVSLPFQAWRETPG